MLRRNIELRDCLKCDASFLHEYIVSNHSQFLHFVDISLSETVTNELWKPNAHLRLETKPI